MPNGKCRYCFRNYGNHDPSCPVAHRDIANTDPEVQERHENLDVYYERNNPDYDVEVEER